MSDFLERLKQDKSELSTKMEALRGFIASENFKKIDPVQMTLLNIQIKAMETYSQCLLEIIVRLDVEKQETSLKNAKVVSIEDDQITFDCQVKLFSEHEQECCEAHYLDMEHLCVSDFDGLEFDLTSDIFFKRIDDYGIELVPKKGLSVKIPGYGFNNGYYSSRMSLVLSGIKGLSREFDISDCQEWNEE